MTQTSHLEKGKILLLRGCSADALPYLKKAYDERSEDPERQSYYAAVNALERGQVGRAIDTCIHAVQAEPENPEIHLNLSRIYMKAGRKKEAYAALEEGRRLDPAHAAVAILANQMGQRRHPVIRFLSRDNVLNKYLGLLSHKWGRYQRRLLGR